MGTVSAESLCLKAVGKGEGRPTKAQQLYLQLPKTKSLLEKRKLLLSTEMRNKELNDSQYDGLRAGMQGKSSSCCIFWLYLGFWHCLV